MSADLTPSERVAVRVFLDETAELVRKAIREKNVSGFGPSNASGRLAASVEVRPTDKGGQVVANKYIEQLVYGRGPTQKQGQGELRAAIRRWIDDKGINSDIPKDSLAFLIARKIHREGTALYRRTGGQDSGLLDEALNEQRIIALLDGLGSELEARITSEVMRTFGGK